jgi:hypothetical protein
LHYSCAKGREKIGQDSRQSNSLDEWNSFLGREEIVTSVANSQAGVPLLLALKEALADGSNTIDDSLWDGNEYRTQLANEHRDSTWHVEGVQQTMGEFRELKKDQLDAVEKLRSLNAIMGAALHIELSYGLHISVPSTPSRIVFEDGKSNVFLSNGSYGSGHEEINGFKDGVLGTILGETLSDINNLHLWVQDLCRTMETQGCAHFSLYHSYSQAVTIST